ncbi:hypothetical protein [Actinoplanes sp. N902-109]|uniref:hypothetical protein n=1 Tax=Actinoplanes sp. (strain N902-109) TaxID=649831 RepID=UPI0003295BFF|nr:hypothetical protein [Actinoplanes sp. N902-109]AGL21355.1 hypothetical protein L083_7845 [Actinoplanes sp. N902-109]
MRSLGTHRAVLATGVAAVAAFALAGCGAGQVAETAIKKPSVPGVNADNADRSVFIRNLSVEYAGIEGYAAGDDATLGLGLYNQTESPITVLISSQPATGNPKGDDVVSAQRIGITGESAAEAASPAPSVAPEPSGSRNSGGEDDQSTNEMPTPAASDSRRPSATASPAASEAADEQIQPARIELPALGSVVYQPTDREKLRAIGLTGKLAPGAALNLVFEFSNNADPLTVQAPVSVPLTPAPRGSAATDEDAGEETGTSPR